MNFPPSCFGTSPSGKQMNGGLLFDLHNSSNYQVFDEFFVDDCWDFCFLRLMSDFWTV